MRTTVKQVMARHSLLRQALEPVFLRHHHRQMATERRRHRPLQLPLLAATARFVHPAWFN